MGWRCQHIETFNGHRVLFLTTKWVSHSNTYKPTTTVIDFSAYIDKTAGRLKGPTRGVKFLNGSETRSRLYAYTSNVQAYVGYCSRRADMITSVCNVRRPLGSSTWRQSFPIPTWHCPGNSKEAAHVGSTKMPR